MARDILKYSMTSWFHEKQPSSNETYERTGKRILKYANTVVSHSIYPESEHTRVEDLCDIDANDDLRELHVSFLVDQ
jgi:hypothetical protein